MGMVMGDYTYTVSSDGKTLTDSAFGMTVDLSLLPSPQVHVSSGEPLTFELDFQDRLLNFELLSALVDFYAFAVRHHAQVRIC